MKEVLLSSSRPKPRPRDVARIGRALKMVWSAASAWLIKLIIDRAAKGFGGADPSSTFRDVALLVGLAATVELAMVIHTCSITDESSNRGRTPNY